MPAKRVAIVRTPLAQSEDEDVSVVSFIRGVATTVHRLNGDAPHSDGSALLEKFLKLHPLVFKGEVDPLGSEGWLKKLTKIFEAMKVPDEKKLILVPYILEDEAGFWWDMVTKTEDMDTMSWSGFEKLFLAKYFPEVEREARREEFGRLLQRGLTMAQYEAKFTELSRHAKDMEEKKVRRFLRGLRPPIHDQLVVLMLTEYRDVVDRALIVERCFDDRQRMYARRNEKRSGIRPQGSGGFIKKQKV